MGDGEATWPATSVSLISGEHDAVLIDALITFEEAGRVVDWIRESGKNLTTIYITHGHGDHFFGLNTILAAFPDARAVTAAAVVPLRRDRSVLRGWASGARSSRVRFPSSRSCREALDGDVIDLEDQELRIVAVEQADTAPSTIVHIPSLDAVIAGDVVYNGIHQWMAETDHESRTRWLASVEQVEALEPKIVVAGHKRPDARDDDPAAIFSATKAYILDFEQSLAESRSAQELVDKMTVLHGDRGNPYTLWTAAQAAFAQGPGAAS